MNAAWVTWFVFTTALLVGVTIEAAVIYSHHRARQRGSRPNCEPIPWRELEHYR